MSAAALGCLSRGEAEDAELELTAARALLELLLLLLLLLDRPAAPGDTMPVKAPGVSLLLLLLLLLLLQLCSAALPASSET